MAANATITSRITVTLAGARRRQILIDNTKAKRVTTDEFTSINQRRIAASGSFSIGPVVDFISIETTADVTVRMRQAGGTWQEFTCTAFLMWYGSIGEVELVNPSADTAVSVSVTFS